MAVLKICTVPDPVLRRKTKPIKDIDASVQKLIDNMVDTLHHASGVGLAAPQVGTSLRMAIIEVPEQELIVLINPEIVKRAGKRVLPEGCLSIPGYQGEVVRSEWVKVKAKDRNGKEIRLKGEGLLGQALEHEIDHLDGVLYVDRLESEDKFYKIVAEDEEEAEAQKGEII
jgi:peptide deformylase